MISHSLPRDKIQTAQPGILKSLAAIPSCCKMLFLTVTKVQYCNTGFICRLLLLPILSNTLQACFNNFHFCFLLAVLSLTW